MQSKNVRVPSPAVIIQGTHSDALKREDAGDEIQGSTVGRRVRRFTAVSDDRRDHRIPRVAAAFRRRHDAPRTDFDYADAGRRRHGGGAAGGAGPPGRRPSAPRLLPAGALSPAPPPANLPSPRDRRTDARDQVSDNKSVIPDPRSLTSDPWHLTSDPWHLSSDPWPLSSDPWRRRFNASN